MAAKAEALAKQFEAKVQEATGVFDRLSDADWKRTASEQWTVGVVAHHVAGGHEGISGIIKTVASTSRASARPSAPERPVVQARLGRQGPSAATACSAYPTARGRG